MGRKELCCVCDGVLCVVVCVVWWLCVCVMARALVVVVLCACFSACPVFVLMFLFLLFDLELMAN